MTALCPLTVAWWSGITLGCLYRLSPLPSFTPLLNKCIKRNTSAWYLLCHLRCNPSQSKYFTDHVSFMLNMYLCVGSFKIGCSILLELDSYSAKATSWEHSDTFREPVCYVVLHWLADQLCLLRPWMLRCFIKGAQFSVAPDQTWLASP